MMIDSTVMIDVLRQKSVAKNYLESIGEILSISRIVWMEIVVGCKSKLELMKSIKLIGNLGLEIIEIGVETSQLAGMMFEKYYHAHGLGITDALIAAAAIGRNEMLATHNVKHFKFIKELNLTVPY